MICAKRRLNRLIQGNLRCFGANCYMLRNTHFVCYFLVKIFICAILHAFSISDHELRIYDWRSWKESIMRADLRDTFCMMAGAKSARINHWRDTSSNHSVRQWTWWQIHVGFWTYTFYNLDNYLLYFRQIHFTFWTNTHYFFDKYIWYFGQIHFACK